jgi:flagella basal body P-ring formation protein FlgA
LGGTFHVGILKMIEYSSYYIRRKPLMSMLRLLVFLFFAQWAATTAVAGPIQNLQILRQLGNDWLEQQAALAWPAVRARARTSAIDERLRLAACRELQFSLPPGARLGKTGSVKVHCTAPARWSLYLGFQMQLSGPALIARRDLPARTILGAADLEMRTIDYEKPPSAYLSDLRLALGGRANRRIPAGQPLLAEGLSRPPAVNAGQHVRIVVRGAGFSIDEEGSALNTAAVGEPVRVKIRSGRIVHGLAQDDGSVLVQP